ARLDMDSLCLHGAIGPSGVQLAGWLHHGRSVYLQGMCPMREFREYFSVVTRPVTSAGEVTSRCRSRSPDQPGTARSGPAQAGTGRGSPCRQGDPVGVMVT